MRNDDVKPDWWCVLLDETDHWNIDPQDKPKVRKISGSYYYDANSYTYCCEITPSYLLLRVGTVVEVDPELDDEERERLCSKYEDAGGHEECYVHVWRLKDREGQHHWGQIEPDDVDFEGMSDDERRRAEEDFVRECLQGNPVF